MLWSSVSVSSIKPPRGAARSSSRQPNRTPLTKTAGWPRKPSRLAACSCSARRNRLAVTVNAGARLDRLPISSFHRRIMWLIGIGMFFDGFDIYVAATVLGATVKSGFSTLSQSAQFVSLTFLGMMLGSFLTGFFGDRYGRRFTYQANLAIFGLASLASALAPSMGVLILLRLVMGIGLGAENVVGYSTMTEFVPPQARGKWLGLMSVFVVAGLPVSALVGTLIIPSLGW